MSDYRRVSLEHADKKSHWLSDGEVPIPTPNLYFHEGKVMLCLRQNIKGLFRSVMVNLVYEFTADIPAQE
ncbi:hypothetical protein Y032_0165g9 [Ancylostoma ceylanicum]|uniref:Uncharacterized protein n=1 Tax=Ancylostoma ceylanicum TaxID=53326 RepID=A0A016SXE5_9BILA|nr:hypothetical protein Y032_0165g9 [Ancylostoma ceylanicum]